MAEVRRTDRHRESDYGAKEGNVHFRGCEVEGDEE